jgi:cation diffusion facilitator CzcD-associated flavoprotein CzcO
MTRNAHSETVAAAAQADTKKVLDVLVIGTGFAGVCVGIKLLEKGITNFRIYEKSQGIGGTWYDNTYPGAACDVPSHFYGYSFEPNPNWSRVYSPQAEIQEYIERCVDKHGLRRHIVHDMRVTRMRLDEARGLWMVSFANGKTVEAHHVINGFGGLHQPLMPSIPGRDSFAGPSMHTRTWDHSVDLVNKRVAVIGSAASAIQVIPELARIAANVTVFQRTPNYILPRGDRAYTDKEKRRFAHWPWIQRLYRWWLYKRMDVLTFPIIKKDSKMGEKASARVIEHMRKSIRDPAMHAHMEPAYAMGCKRMLLSDDLFRALNRDNVQTELTGIASIEPGGVRTADGKLHAADVIIYATGFDVEGHQRSIEVFGRGGRSLNEDWAHCAAAYRGTCVAGYPNYWLVTGPNTGVATTSIVFMIEQTVRFIVRMVEAAGNTRLVEVKKGAQDACNAWLQEQMKDTVWVSGCKSFYLNAEGKVTTLFPGNARSFRRLLARIRWSDFEVSEPARMDRAA